MNEPTDAAEDANRELKTATRAMWALGDYHKFATETVWEIGPVLVEACGISAGQRRARLKPPDPGWIKTVSDPSRPSPASTRSAQA